jgi:hypothetical protein
MAAEIELTFGKVQARLECGFDRTGANLFLVEGSHGTLIVQPPFIAARQVLEMRGPPAKLFASMSGSSKAARAFAKLARTVPLPGVRRHSFDFPGYGLQFEIAAATQAIAEGRTGTLLAPLAESLETLRIIEHVRSNAAR